jgi:polyhydroxyalkanoate synthesis regulator phasin
MGPLYDALGGINGVLYHNFGRELIDKRQKRIRILPFWTYNLSSKERRRIMLKELLYTGMGGALLLKEKVEEELKKLEEKGKLNATDSKSFLEGLKTRGEDEEKRLKEELKTAIKEVIEELGIATKKDIEALRP